MTHPPILGTLETALYAGDIDAAEAFYGGLIGLPVVARAGNRHIFFRVGEGVLLIFNPEETVKPPGNPALPVPPHGTLGPGHYCLAVPPEAIDLWKHRMEEAGVTIEADFHWPNGARSIYVRDPAGNSVEFADPAIWG
ncbi:VOC family protein [Cereibacter sphaeroides]|uniref:VOC family protein n=1 Tax=Cereibacter sphaeroides TaxID=1063 RepID=UPI001F38C63F|nr:VOC family protein [Cereibacter sphaeroides]MCE6961008.1 VOC family protein [Cereibacter sphaeroides]MCE6969694.1 VOC family protein [Cereibacter sphaeroides]MCE6975169.1 VOC family protein [Cereibacter sphaeroides]